MGIWFWIERPSLSIVLLNILAQFCLALFGIWSVTYLEEWRRDGRLKEGYSRAKRWFKW